MDIRARFTAVFFETFQSLIWSLRSQQVINISNSSFCCLESSLLYLLRIISSCFLMLRKWEAKSVASILLPNKSKASLYSALFKLSNILQFSVFKMHIVCARWCLCWKHTYIQLTLNTYILIVTFYNHNLQLYLHNRTLRTVETG